MRAWMPAWAAAIAFLVLLAPTPAQAAPRDRLSVAAPNPGDVTLVRVLIVSRVQPGARPSGLALRPVDVPDDVQIAVVGRIQSPEPGRALSDVTLALARPATADASAGERITILLRGRGIRSTLLDDDRQPNSRFFFAQQSDCDHYAEPLAHPNFARYLTAGPWSLDPARFAADAVSWGCPQRGDTTEAAFTGLMAGALGTAYVTWLTDPAGQITRVCVYIHDVGGALTQVTAGAVSEPLAFTEETVALVKLDVAAPRLGVQLRRAPGYLWAETIGTAPAPPEPPALAAAAGPCAG